MEKLREMNRDIFKNNLLKTIEEIKNVMNLNINEAKFKIVAISEPDKPLNARDDSMRLIALSEKNIGSRLLSLDDATRLLSCKAPFVPIWINVSFLKYYAVYLRRHLKISLNWLISE
ncbi:hypothetical protein [Clostridium sp. E02]|uniref:hypothetical protein n=1 Tax=Clostridium sp. E02 TaxID=2487134 RepID=UPI000F51B5DE|nr:hypothetical protein [Clostridium sp. E02]